MKSRLLLKTTALAALFIIAGKVGWGQTTIFTESMGTVSATTATSVHEAADGFDNDGYTMASGDLVGLADIRNANPSAGYPGASGGAGVWFSTAGAERGFSIEGINASTFINLTLQFGYRKESATELPPLNVDFWNGSAWVNVPYTFNEAANALNTWYLSPAIPLPEEAQIAGLKIRWRKLGTSPGARLDDVKLISALQSGSKSITSFTVASQIGTTTINQTAKTISFVMPPAATSFTPTIGVSPKATVSPLSGVAQTFVSGTPIPYTVTAEDGSTKIYQVTAKNASTAKDILTFDFAAPATTGVVNSTLHTVTLTVPSGTAVTALVPTITVSPFATVSPLSAVANDFTTPATYTVTAEDGTTQPWTVTVIAPSIATDILTFDFATPAVVGTVDPVLHSVALTVPYGTVVTALVPTITLSAGATVSPLTAVANDFTSPATYTVTAEDPSYTQPWTVTVTIAPASTANDILTFDFATPAVVGTVDAVLQTVALTVPYGTVLTALVPTITVSPFATVSPLTAVANDFTAPATYTVTAQDGTPKAWIVTVLIASATATDIETFDFNGLTPAVVGTVNSTTHKVALTVPYGTNVTALVPTITLSAGATVSPLTAVSGDFTAPKTYTVTAQDGSTTEDWIVTVSIALNTATDILTFDFATPATTGVVNATLHTVALTVPMGTIVTALVPTITLSAGATVSPLTGVAADFSAPKTYTVTAQDGSTTQAWTVTVTSVLPTLTLNALGASSFYAGDAVALTWTSSGITNVKVELYNGSTYSTLLASTPADGAESVTIPAATPWGTAYKIRISDASLPSVNSQSSAFTVKAVTSNLADLLTMPANAVVKYTGNATVTYARTTRNQKFIQDATGAVLIDDNTTAPGFITGTYNIGDGITNVEGKIVLSDGLTKLTPTSTTGATTTGNPVITPEVKTMASLTVADQSKLIKVTNFYFLYLSTEGNASGNFALATGSAAYNYTISDGTTRDTLYHFRTAFSEANYIGTKIPTVPKTVVALLGIYKKNASSKVVMQITARNLADFLVTGIDEEMDSNLSVYPNPFTNEIRFDAKQNLKRIVITSITGQVMMNVSVAAQANRIETDNLPKGMYIVTFMNDKGERVNQKMIKE